MNTEATPLERALTDLASTMSHNPDRLRQVRSRVDRRRRRRVATGAAVSAGAVAATLGIAAIPRSPRSSLQSSVAASALHSCASVPAPEPHVPTTLLGDKPGVNDRPATPDAVARYKGYAVVHAVDSATVTLGGLTGLGPVPAVETLVTVVDSTTLVVNGSRPAVAADVAVGQKIMFSVTLAETGAHLDYIDIAGGSAPANEPTADRQAAADKQANADKLTDADKQAIVDKLSDKQAAADAITAKGDPTASADGTVEGKGVVESASAGELVVNGAVGHGDMGVVRLQIGADTKFFRYDTACTIDGQFTGSGVLFSAIANGDGTYTATEVRFFD